jgi:predicted HAD superfamily hydrolase
MEGYPHTVKKHLDGCNQTGESPWHCAQAGRERHILIHHTVHNKAKKMTEVWMNCQMHVGIHKIDGRCPQRIDKIATNGLRSFHLEFWIYNVYIESLEIQNRPPCTRSLFWYYKETTVKAG